MHQFAEYTEKEIMVLISPPLLPEMEVAMLTMYGFSPYIYADVLFDYISVGFDQSIYDIISAECSESNLSNNCEASIISSFEIVAKHLLNYILARPNLHFLLLTDMREVEINESGNWLIHCTFSESKYAIHQTYPQYQLTLPNFQGQQITSYSTPAHITARYQSMA